MSITKSPVGSVKSTVWSLQVEFCRLWSQQSEFCILRSSGWVLQSEVCSLRFAGRVLQPVSTEIYSLSSAACSPICRLTSAVWDLQVEFCTRSSTLYVDFDKGLQSMVQYAVLICCQSYRVPMRSAVYCMFYQTVHVCRSTVWGLSALKGPQFMEKIELMIHQKPTKFFSHKLSLHV